jgi:hypothetical protein
MLLYLDAGNTTSYPGSGTTWYDLSGKSNNTISTSGTTYNSANGGYFDFNGSGYFQTAGSKYNTSYTGKTVFLAAKLSSAMGSGTFRCLFGGGGSPVGRNFNTYFYYTGSAYQIHFSSNNQGGFSPNLTYSVGNWFTLAVTQTTGNVLTWYFNGRALGTSSVAFSQYVTDQYVQVGASDNYWTGPISVVGVYGSALSTQEIKNCHYSVAARYGL